MVKGLLADTPPARPFQSTTCSSTSHHLHRWSLTTDQLSSHASRGLWIPELPETKDMPHQRLKNRYIADDLAVGPISATSSSCTKNPGRSLKSSEQGKCAQQTV